MKIYAYVVPPELDLRAWRPEELARIREANASAWWRTTVLARQLCDHLALKNPKAELESDTIRRAIGAVFRVNSTRIRHGYMLRYQSLGLIEATSPGKWALFPDRSKLAAEFGRTVLGRIHALYPEPTLLAEDTLHDLARSFVKQHLPAANVPLPLREVPQLGAMEGDVRVCHNSPAYRTAFDLRNLIDIMWAKQSESPEGPVADISTSWIREHQKQWGINTGAEPIQRMISLGEAIGVFQRGPGTTRIRFRYAPLVNHWCWARLTDGTRFDTEALEAIAVKSRQLHEEKFGPNLEHPDWRSVFDAWVSVLEKRHARALGVSEVLEIGGERFDINPPHVAAMLEPPLTLGEKMLEEGTTILEKGYTQAVCAAVREGAKTKQLWLFPKKGGDFDAVVREVLETKPDFMLCLARTEFVAYDADLPETKHEILSYTGRAAFFAPKQAVAFSTPMRRTNGSWACSWWRPDPATFTPDETREATAKAFDAETPFLEIARRIWQKPT